VIVTTLSEFTLIQILSFYIFFETTDPERPGLLQALHSHPSAWCMESKRVPAGSVAAATPMYRHVVKLNEVVDCNDHLCGLNNILNSQALIAARGDSEYPPLGPDQGGFREGPHLVPIDGNFHPPSKWVLGRSGGGKLHLWGEPDAQHNHR
jgi:hypothetical protein